MEYAITTKRKNIMITVFRKNNSPKIYDNHTFDIIDKCLYIYDVDRVICVYADGNWTKITIDDEQHKPSGTTSPVMGTYG